jgi:hypothetical protein
MLTSARMGNRQRTWTRCEYGKHRLLIGRCGSQIRWPISSRLLADQGPAVDGRFDVARRSRMDTDTLPALIGADDPMLRLAIAAHLARYKGRTRAHTASDLNAYLRWCLEHDVMPLQAQRGPTSTRTRSSGATRGFAMAVRRTAQGTASCSAAGPPAPRDPCRHDTTTPTDWDQSEGPLPTRPLSVRSRWSSRS